MISPPERDAFVSAVRVCAPKMISAPILAAPFLLLLAAAAAPSSPLTSGVIVDDESAEYTGKWIRKPSPAVLAGKTYLAPAAAAKLAEGVMRVQVTPRELSTLRLMADGKSNKEIAGVLGITERTVKTHLGHLFEKLGVTSRTEAVRVATRRGLVRFD